MKWNDLTMKERSDLMGLFLKSGVGSLSDMKHIYDGFQDTVEKVNRSDANFVKRLKDKDRKYIQDWENRSSIATHKLGVEYDNNGNPVIYPNVQEIDGELIDFTRPPYYPFAGLDEAIERRDTVRVNSIEEGLRFTEGYKDFYPKGHTFDGKSNTNRNLFDNPEDDSLLVRIRKNITDFLGFTDHYTDYKNSQKIKETILKEAKLSEGLPSYAKRLPDGTISYGEEPLESKDASIAAAVIPSVGVGETLYNVGKGVITGNPQYALISAASEFLPDTAIKLFRNSNNTLLKALPESTKVKKVLTHGMHPYQFKDAINNWNGLPMPSLALTDKDIPETLFGNKLKFLIDKKALDNSLIFKGDGMTPTIMSVNADIHTSAKEIIDRMRKQQLYEEFNTAPIMTKEQALRKHHTDDYDEVKYQDLLTSELINHALIDVTYPKAKDIISILNKNGIPYTGFYGTNKMYDDSMKEVLSSILNIYDELSFSKGGKLNKTVTIRE